MSKDEGYVGCNIEKSYERNRAKQKKIAKRKKKNKLKIATWNVRSLKHNGKIENIIPEKERMEIDVTGVSDTTKFQVFSLDCV